MSSALRGAGLRAVRRSAGTWGEGGQMSIYGFDKPHPPKCKQKDGHCVFCGACGHGVGGGNADDDCPEGCTPSINWYKRWTKWHSNGRKGPEPKK